MRVGEDGELQEMTTCRWRNVQLSNMHCGVYRSGTLTLAGIPAAGSVRYFSVIVHLLCVQAVY